MLPRRLACRRAAIDARLPPNRFALLVRTAAARCASAASGWRLRPVALVCPPVVAHHARRQSHEHGLGAHGIPLVKLGEEVLGRIDGVHIGEREHELVGEARLEAFRAEVVLHAELVKELPIDCVDCRLCECHLVEDRGREPGRVSQVGHSFEAGGDLIHEGTERAEEGVHGRTPALADREKLDTFEGGAHDDDRSMLLRADLHKLLARE